MSTQQAGLFPELPIRPMTRRLVERMLFDLPLSPAMISDYGVTSEAHYRALRDALFAAPEDLAADEAEDVYDLSGLRRRMVELDRALGHGSRLTAFVRQYARHDAAPVRFRTVWDILARRATPKQT